MGPDRPGAGPVRWPAVHSGRHAEEGHLVRYRPPGGVSQSTVSRALRGSPLVNRETTRRILEAAEQLHHKVDKHASSLRTQRAGTLALLLFEDPTSDASHINPFFLPMLGSITRACARHGQDLLISFQQLSDDWHADYADSKEGGRADPARLRRLPRPSRQRFCSSWWTRPRPSCAGARCCQASPACRSAATTSPAGTRPAATCSPRGAGASPSSAMPRSTSRIPRPLPRLRRGAVRGRRLARSRVAGRCRKLRGFGLRRGAGNRARRGRPFDAVFAASDRSRSARCAPSPNAACACRGRGHGRLSTTFPPRFQRPRSPPFARTPNAPANCWSKRCGAPDRRRARGSMAADHAGGAAVDRRRLISPRRGSRPSPSQPRAGPRA